MQGPINVNEFSMRCKHNNTSHGKQNHFDLTNITAKKCTIDLQNSNLTSINISNITSFGPGSSFNFAHNKIQSIEYKGVPLNKLAESGILSNVNLANNPLPFKVMMQLNTTDNTILQKCIDNYSDCELIVDHTYSNNSLEITGTIKSIQIAPTKLQSIALNQLICTDHSLIRIIVIQIKLVKIEASSGSQSSPLAQTKQMLVQTQKTLHVLVDSSLVVVGNTSLGIVIWSNCKLVVINDVSRANLAIINDMLSNGYCIVVLNKRYLPFEYYHLDTIQVDVKKLITFDDLAIADTVTKRSKCRKKNCNCYSCLYFRKQD